jgi:dienelactone hydrolase
LPGLREWVDKTERQLAFRAGSDVEHWQHELRAKLIDLLGMASLEAVPPKIQIIESSVQDGYYREFIKIQVAPGEQMPCYVLLPDGNTAAPPAIALHGHGTWTAKSVIGLAESAEEQAYIDQFHSDYGLPLVRQGYVVYVPVLRGMGQRMESFDGSGMWQSSCQEVSLNAMLCGKTLLGLRVWDVMRLIDFIDRQHLPSPIPCVGFSGGGTLAMFTAALDQRIERVIVSGYLNTFRDSIMAIPHCACNYVPRLLEYAEMSDIAGLIAPRLLHIEHGRLDPIFPLAGLEKAYSALQEIYQSFGAASALDLNIFEGEHRWDGQGVAAWLERTR